MKKDEVAIRDDERRKIGEELHDNISNEILQLQFLLLKSENFLSSELFTEIMTQTDFIRRQIRNLSHKLVQTNICDNSQVSLAQTIKDILLDFVYLHTNLTFNLYLFPKQHTFVLPSSIVTELKMIVTELIHNSIIHGKSNIIELSLTNHPDSISIMLTDNGAGFNTGKKTDGIGLINCKNRIKNLNSQMTIESAINKGATININLKK